MATTTQKILGESVKVEVGNLDVIVDGDIEVTIEREVVEHKERGKAVVEHILSKRIKISGSLSFPSLLGSIKTHKISINSINLKRVVCQ